MDESAGGGFQWGYFEKQLSICVSNGMSPVSQEEKNTFLFHVLLLPLGVLFLSAF